MKRILVASFIMMMAALSATALSPRGQSANIVGSWDFTIESPQGTRTVLLVIKKDGDKLGGTMKSPRGERPLDSITVKGDDITLTMTQPIQGQDVQFTYKGKVAKDSMKGDADFGGFATGTWSAVPHKEDAAAVSPAAAPAQGVNISGAWSFTVETSQGSGSPTFTFKQDGENLTGTYKGQFGEAPLTGTVKGADIKFAIKINAQGQDLTLTYSGKVESKDSMKGTVALGELGEGTWTAKRK
jgi:hypothetical protein